MTWKELAAEFNQRFGPDSKNPVFLTWSGRLPDNCGIFEFFKEKLFTAEAEEALKKAHFSASLDVGYSRGPFEVDIITTMLQSHPLWDETIRHRADITRRSTVLTIARKKLPDNYWGVIIKEAGRDEIALEKSWPISQIEYEMKRDYQSAVTIANAMQKLSPEEAVAFKDAVLHLFGLHNSACLDLNFCKPLQYHKEPENRKNLFLEETRKRLSDKLALFYGKPVEERPEPPLDISLRDYIAGAEVLEEGKTCPPELVDDAMDWLLHGRNDLLERLDGIIRDAVNHAVDASNY